MSAMYQEHFGLNQPPFRITPQTEHFYPGAQRGPLLEALTFAVNHDEGIVRVSGEVGTGKTMLCRMLIERLPGDVLVIYIANPSLSPSELIATIAQELSIRPDPEHSLLRQIERQLIELYAQGRRVVAIIDEAHAMPLESLDQVRLLSNLETGTRKLLQIVLFGQPELDAILAQKTMRSLRERITQNFKLQPLKQPQIKEYLDFRLRAAGYRGPELFNPKVLALISRASLGLTRRVNILADKTLLAAFADNTHTIKPSHAQAALRDAAYKRPLPWARILWTSGICLLITGACSILLFTDDWRHPNTMDGAPAAHAASKSSRQNSSTPETKPPSLSAGSTVDQRAVLNQEHPASNAPEQFVPIPAELGPLARERVIASRAEMEHISDQQWFIQLRSIPASNAASLESFIPSATKALDENQLRLFIVKDDPKQTIGVIYGNYSSSKEAYAALSRLPAWLKAASPFLRTFKSLRADASRKK